MKATTMPIGEPRAVARSGKRGSLLDDRAWRWATFAPALLFMLGLSVLPLVNLVATSFHEVSWVGASAVWQPVGTDHYEALPNDPLFRAGLVNTIIFAVSAVAGQMVLGFALALLCSRLGSGRVVYRTIFILPILIPGIVIGAIWKLMLNFDFGPVNQLIGMFGLMPHDWLGSSATALLSVIVVDIWHWTPFCFLLFLAGLESLPQDVYEAAQIDGASRWQELRYVTIPLMVPTIVVTFAFRLVLAFKVFDEVYLLTGGGPGTATEVISFTLYQRFFTEDRVGYGSAMGVAVIFLVSLLLVVALNARRKREGMA
ncbi:carbohydrate ABC transporter permease [Shumkonia mesophila]|uniref:carbohydrate ABC transporter permease n=1 Tax=Shumkonia mesophila TaxID=2838854 RepID=UPI002934D3AD|nr:sugar ABC transporter permease [Shumkonia mesophila]